MIEPWVAENCGVPLLPRAALADPSSEVPGVPADFIDNLGSPEGMIELVGQSLRVLHDTPLGIDAGDLFADGWDARASQIAQRRDANLIKPASLPDPYSRYGAERLVEMWREGRPDLDGTTADELVLCHGAPSLDNIIVDQGELVGFVGLDQLCIGDRHLDLAVIHRSLQATIGGEAAFIFYDAYGIDPNVVRLDHYMFADLLLS